VLQKTIAKSVEFMGIGLHEGLPIHVRLEPMGIDSGILFYCSNSDTKIPLCVESVVDTTMATVIGKGGNRVSTIEHFLSVVYAYDIDNLSVTLDGAEMPMMDGSAISFCLLLNEAGVVTQSTPKKIISLKRRVEIRDGAKYAKLEPSDKTSFHFDIDFPHPAIGKQSFEYTFSKDNFIDKVARARTFGFTRDMQYLQSRNLALGASLKNAIGLDDRRVLNPEGLRFENEFVRHKVLDAMGDLMVMGHRVLGAYSAFASSHRLNHLLTKELLSDSDNYEILELGNIAS